MHRTTETDLLPELPIRQLVLFRPPGPLLAIPQPDLLVHELATVLFVLRQHSFGVSWISHRESCRHGGETGLICTTSALSGCIRPFGRSSTTFVRALGEAASRVRTIPSTEAGRY